ncbi:polysaccharide deacetylase family protein [Peribacillus muralis]|uniref:polysaccharide deacetylase family protein n=1 Tax=Peribacillus muralis TaxID=264697 RepID=UPI001F4E9177|nr:polysaccharide deacetylase family protein [Peribacillus muralis]MCK1992952.1 polysaccharide deacetylase family protein [Peribacillus muralis]MCK2013507.1 polysaccharide deacetylase family protein [Peribacillus muralis]
MMSVLQEKWQKVIPALLQGGYIRVINFHNTPGFRVEEYERQLSFYREHFESVSEEDLNVFFETKKWKKPKPGLILSFYNGYRNNYDIMYPLLEKYGFIGRFFVATEFLSIPAEYQKEYAGNHTLGLINDEYDDYRQALSWDEVRELGKRHIIASHTKTHSKLMLSSTHEEMAREIIDSKQEIEEQLQREISSFAWLGGEEYASNPGAAHYLKLAGYQYLFSNLKIEKITAKE